MKYHFKTYFKKMGADFTCSVKCPKRKQPCFIFRKEKKTMNENKKDGLGYKMGSILTVVITLCLMVATIGVTIKFLFWLF
jgi:hypothetical protein